jgi:hypothetical protein
MAAAASALEVWLKKADSSNNGSQKFDSSGDFPLA